MIRHKAFISYHHENDQYYKDKLIEMNKKHNIFIDMSVNTGDIDDDLTDDRIREIIRDEYLRDSTVTIVIVGRKTRERKHVDWEIYSSMYDGAINKKSGILVIETPDVSLGNITVSMSEEYKRAIFPEISSWTSPPKDKSEREEYYNKRYPFAPKRIIDNLVNGAPITIVPWGKVYNNPERLRLLIDAAHQSRGDAKYDLSRKMRRRNGP